MRVKICKITQNNLVTLVNLNNALDLFGATSELSSSMCCGERSYELDGDQKQLMALEVQTLDVIRPDN